MRNGTAPGTLPEREQGKHLPVVWLACPAGHELATQKASGATMACGRCGQELGRDVLVTVPERTPENTRRSPGTTARPPLPRQPLPRIVRCSGCQGSVTVPAGSGSDRPRGWLSLSVRVPPEATPSGKGTRGIGQWCSVACLARSLPGLARGERAARNHWPAEPPGTGPDNAPPVPLPTRFGDELAGLARLMTEVPPRSR
jgi:hypothetical protein